jgi:uncharacterized membrane protein
MEWLTLLVIYLIGAPITAAVLYRYDKGWGDVYVALAAVYWPVYAFCMIFVGLAMMCLWFGRKFARESAAAIAKEKE